MGSILSMANPDEETFVEGYHIQNVFENSPAAKAGLEAYFDIITAINGIRFVGDDLMLLQLLSENINVEIVLTVYSSRTQTFREILITPSTAWGNHRLLGVTLCYCALENVEKKVYHILCVHPQSPAKLAGLQAYDDYIYGYETNGAVPNEFDIYDLIAAHDQKPLNFFVYNTKHNACRTVTVQLNSDWGGKGLLGCDLGHGYLHRIPLQTTNPITKQITPINSIVNTSASFDCTTESTPVLCLPTSGKHHFEQREQSEDVIIDTLRIAKESDEMFIEPLNAVENSESNNAALK